MKTEYVTRRRVVNSYLVRERERGRLRVIALFVAAVLVPASGFLSYTWIHHEVLREGARIRDLEQQLEELEKAERRLRLEGAELSSPERIERRAKGELGLQPPRLEQMIFLARSDEAMSR